MAGQEECWLRIEGGLATLPMLFLRLGKRDPLMEIAAGIARSWTKFWLGRYFSRENPFLLRPVYSNEWQKVREIPKRGWKEHKMGSRGKE